MTTRGYCMLKFACLDAFLVFFELEVSRVEGQSIQQKDKERRERKGAKKFKKENKNDLGHFLVQKLC